MSRKLPHPIRTIGAITLGFYTAYGFFKFTSTGSWIIDAFITGGAALLGAITFFSVGDSWEIFESKENENQSSTFKARLNKYNVKEGNKQ